MIREQILEFTLDMLVASMGKRPERGRLRMIIKIQGIMVEIETILVCGSTVMPAPRLEYQTPIWRPSGP